MELEHTSSTIQTLYSYNTEFCADSIEWCPHIPHQNIFVCANYHMQEEEEKGKERKRIGGILLFAIHPATGLKLLQILDTPAILDQKWCHNKVNGHSVLGIANAKKTVEIYKLTFDENNLENARLEIVTQYSIIDDDKETLILSLDWSTGKYDSAEPQLICSDSKGNIHRLKYENENLDLISSWHAHEFEAWIAAFYYWDTNVVFTGGDDSILLKFDNRTGNAPVMKNKSHRAGVTSIHSNAKTEYLLATGSYDSYLRLWDIRYMKNSKEELEMPGTLWRLKWNPHDFQHLLAACMLSGVHIVDTKQQLNIVESYYEHKDLAYGVDWSYLHESELKKFENNAKFLIGSCSFYDHLLCVWTSNCQE